VKPVLITDAERSQDDQLRSRQIRYATMMGLRVVCLIGAAVLVSVRPPLLWLWLLICGAGMVLLPWCAVIIANDRPAKERYRLANRLRRHHPTEPPPPNALAAPPPDRIIDAD